MSNEFMNLVQEAKYDNNALLTLIQFFEPKLKYCLYQTHPYLREDLHQDLLIKLISTIRKYDINTIPGFWEFKNNIADKSNAQ